jgi:hypothetical protein
MDFKDLLQEYSNLCTRIGDYTIQINHLSRKLDKIQTTDSIMTTDDHKQYLNAFNKRKELIDDAELILSILRREE